VSGPDPRLTLARGDLATSAMEGVRPAARYASPELLRLALPSAAVLTAPGPGAEQADQLLYGEHFEALERQGDYLWGQARRDGYVGFVRADALATGGEAPTHRVSHIRTYAFAEPSIKAPARGPYSLNALVAIEAEEGLFAKEHGGGWFWSGHLAPIGRFETDAAAVAERYLGAPYLWGGRDSLGLDCSGLVQQALYACGLACPRDNDQQAALGRGITPQGLGRGDLVVWGGHIGMMLDATRLIHASGHHMAVVVEALEEVLARYAAKGEGLPIAYRRL
jgi:cell wall-associated NlpC family hydrolase